MNMKNTLKVVVLVLALTATPVVVGQITSPRVLSSSRSTSATLEEQLLNRLKATRDDQRAYIKHVVALTKTGKLEQKLVVAVERYALRRNSKYPFPFF
jgi:outer membrane PBP1 activator LpoA protein